MTAGRVFVRIHGMGGSLDSSPLPLPQLTLPGELSCGYSRDAQWSAAFQAQRGRQVSAGSVVCVALCLLLPQHYQIHV